MNESLLTVIIPCYNEAENIPGVLPEITAICEKKHWDLIAVDDGSTDSTLAELQKFSSSPSLTILHHKRNRGYGGAIKTGILAASTRYVATIDADGQHDPADVEKLLEEIQKQDADMIVGRRAKGASSCYRSLGKLIIRLITRCLIDMPVQDQNSGLKLYDREIALKLIGRTPDNMAFSDIILLLFADERCLVIEAPIHIRPRQGGKSTISTKTAVNTLSEILNLVIMFHPMKIFFPMFLFLFIAGVIWSLRSLILGAVLSIGGSFLLLAAMNVLLIGLMAEQFKRLSKR